MGSCTSSDNEKRKWTMCVWVCFGMLFLLQKGGMVDVSIMVCRNLSSGGFFLTHSEFIKIVASSRAFLKIRLNIILFMTNDLQMCKRQTHITGSFNVTLFYMHAFQKCISIIWNWHYPQTVAWNKWKTLDMSCFSIIKRKIYVCGYFMIDTPFNLCMSETCHQGRWLVQIMNICYSCILLNDLLRDKNMNWKVAHDFILVWIVISVHCIHTALKVCGYCTQTMYSKFEVSEYELKHGCKGWEMILWLAFYCPISLTQEWRAEFAKWS